MGFGWTETVFYGAMECIIGRGGGSSSGGSIPTSSSSALLIIDY